MTSMMHSNHQIVELDHFDSYGTVAVTVNGIDLIHLLVLPDNTAQVVVFDRDQNDPKAVVTAADVTVDLYPPDTSF